MQQLAEAPHQRTHGHSTGQAMTALRCQIESLVSYEALLQQQISCVRVEQRLSDCCGDAAAKRQLTADQDRTCVSIVSMQRCSSSGRRDERGVGGCTGGVGLVLSAGVVVRSAQSYTRWCVQSIVCSRV
jgi:hypothetical protein